MSARQDGLAGSLVLDRCKSKIWRTYVDRTPICARSHAKLCQWVTGGNSRMTCYWQPYPITIARGNGYRVWDLDGNEYIDLINNYTSLIHGHAYQPITDVVAQQAPNGLAWAANCTAQAELAELLCERIPSVERVRFANSGSEAGALALMVARAVTGRSKILMAKLGYHGCINEFIQGSLGAGGAHTLVANYNDLNDFERILAAQGDDIAAVFIEPMLSAAGGIRADQHFLQGLARAAKRAGALFVLDEVQAFRLSTGGSQLTTGVKPDLTMLGKIIGGGFPVGALGGTRECMAVFEPAELRVAHGGTFNANPMTMAAGTVAVKHFTAQEVKRLDDLGDHLEKGLRSIAARRNIPFSLNRWGSLINIMFQRENTQPERFKDSYEITERFHLASMNHGLSIASRGYIVLSTPMDNAVVAQILERFDLAMADIAAEIQPDA